MSVIFFCAYCFGLSRLLIRRYDGRVYDNGGVLSLGHNGQILGQRWIYDESSGYHCKYILSLIGENKTDPVYEIR